MTGTALLLLALTALVAAGDWRAVRHSRRFAHLCLKPLTMVCLGGVALAIEPDDPAARGWFVVALAFSLAGDVFLMLPTDQFIAGLASFLAAHVAYIVGLVVGGVDWIGLLVGVAIVAVPVRLVGVDIIRSARLRTPKLAAPVVAYVAVISAMVVTAIATGRPFAIVGAGLFYASDALIGWNRFVREQGWQPLAIIATYHLGQVGLVLSLT